MASDHGGTCFQILTDGLSKRFLREELLVREGVESVNAFQRRKVHVEVGWVEACHGVHINLVEEQIFVDEAWTIELNRVRHDER